MAKVVRCKTGKPCKTSSGTVVCIPKSHKCQSEHTEGSEPDRPVAANNLPQSQEAFNDTPVTSEKKPIIAKEDNALVARLSIGQVTGAAVVSSLAGVAITVKNDLKKTSLTEAEAKLIPPNPPGNPEDWKELNDYYNTLKPGDLIRRNFKTPDGGTLQHYGVYAGKNPDADPNSIHAHLVIEAGLDYGQQGQPGVRQSGLTSFRNPEQMRSDSSWQKVPEDEMHQKKGTKKMSEREIMNRANKMLYQTFTYTGFESNCESFARGIVEGKAYSTQHDKVSPLTNHISKFVLGAANRVEVVNLGDVNKKMKALENAGQTHTPKYQQLQRIKDKKPILQFKGKNGNTTAILGKTGYGSDKHRMTAQEMIEFLDHAKARSERKREGSRDWRAYDPTQLNKEVPRKSQQDSNNSIRVDEIKTQANSKLSFFSGIFPFKGTVENIDPMAFLDPNEYMENLEAIAAKYPQIKDKIREDGVSTYLLAFYSLLNNAMV